MTDDIVARLRHIEGGYGFRAICREAADEIERLREALRIEQEEFAACCIDRKETQRERDEARRGWCMARAVIRWDIEHPNSPQRSETTIILLAWQIADEEGWNCFEGIKR